MTIITTKNFRLILDCFGYYAGAEFESPEEVREYLSEASLINVFGESGAGTPEMRERLADLAIEHKEHWAS